MPKTEVFTVMQSPKRVFVPALICGAIGMVICAAACALGYPPSVFAQSVPRSAAPDWQISAGRTLSFDVASVKLNLSGDDDSAGSNVPLGPDDNFTPTGGLFSAVGLPLSDFVLFAYKLTPHQLQDALSQMPKWTAADRFDIQARASGNPDKDQFRLMMQALLADRFHLAFHYETRQLPVFALVLNRPEKLGPGLRRHPDNPPCAAAPSPHGPTALIAGGFPATCGALSRMKPGARGRIRLGARNMSMEMILKSLPLLKNSDRPILDETGLTGTYDFVIEYVPQPDRPIPNSRNFVPDISGATSLEALKEQLGLKLESRIGPVNVLVVDHLEPPSPN